MKIKICGITRFEDALHSIQGGADAIGFIFFPKSKRYIDPIKAKEIIHSLPPFSAVVGVFVDEDPDKVNEIAKFTGLNYVQLHGNESQNYIEQISPPIIKGFGIDESFDFSKLDEYKDCKYLLDVKDKYNFGGTGKTFDWGLIPENIRKKVIIAGGVSADNIMEIYQKIDPSAVDLSSSVEISPGIKDKSKITEVLKFINQIKQKSYDN